MDKTDKNEEVSSGPELGDLAFWDMDSPEGQCDCPGPPPQFYLPPPPPSSSLIDSSCSDQPFSNLESCKAITVIDAEYQYNPAIPSLAIILIVSASTVILLCLGIILLVMKKKKVQHLLPRKSLRQNNCDTSTLNGVLYEDLNTGGSQHCPPGQTILPSSVEMIDIGAFTTPAVLSSMVIRSPSLLPDNYHSQDLFNPMYEELSSGSIEREDTDSEGLSQAPISDDEFVEKESDLRVHKKHSKEINLTDADDRCRFLRNNRKTCSRTIDFGDLQVRPQRLTHLHHPPSEKMILEGRRRGKKKNTAFSEPPPEFNDFHEGLLLKTLFRFCPNGTEADTNYCHTPLKTSDISTGNEENSQQRCHAHTASSLYGKPEIFTTHRAVHDSEKKIGQESSFISNSRYCKYKTRDKTSSRSRKHGKISEQNELGSS